MKLSKARFWLIREGEPASGPFTWNEAIAKAAELYLRGKECKIEGEYTLVCKDRRKHFVLSQK